MVLQLTGPRWTVLLFSMVGATIRAAPPAVKETAGSVSNAALQLSIRALRGTCLRRVVVKVLGSVVGLLLLSVGTSYALAMRGINGYFEPHAESIEWKAPRPGPWWELGYPGAVWRVDFCLRDRGPLDCCFWPHAYLSFDGRVVGIDDDKALAKFISLHDVEARPAVRR